jgi:hypothetical protein
MSVAQAPRRSRRALVAQLQASCLAAVLGSGDRMSLLAGLSVGMALSIVAVLLGLAATMTVQPEAPPIAGQEHGATWARPVLLVIPVLAGTGPVAYVLCLALQR